MLIQQDEWSGPEVEGWIPGSLSATLVKKDTLLIKYDRFIDDSSSQSYLVLPEE